MDDSLTQARSVVAARQADTVNAIVVGGAHRDDAEEWKYLRQRLWLKRINDLVEQAVLLAPHFPDQVQRVREFVDADGFVERSEAGWFEWFLCMVAHSATPEELDDGLEQVLEFELRRSEALSIIAAPSDRPNSRPGTAHIAPGVALVVGSLDLASAYNDESQSLLHATRGQLACLIVPPGLDGRLGVYAAGEGIVQLIASAELGLLLARLSERQRSAVAQLVAIGALR